MTLTPLDLKTMEQINKHAYGFTISADAWKEDSKRKWVDASKVADELEAILEMQYGKGCIKTDVKSITAWKDSKKLFDLIKTLRGNGK